jgi:hypothetical protein
MTLKDLQAWSVKIKEEQTSIHYPLDFKMAVSKHIDDTGVAGSRVAQQLGLIKGVVLKWHQKFGRKEFTNMKWIQR